MPDQGRQAQQTRERLVAELTEPLLDLGLDLEALDLTPAGRRRVLRIAVDKDGGVTMDEVAEATKAISRLLDRSEALGEQPYTLEVTSPGIDRPLTLPRHWRRNRGRLVKAVGRDGRTLLGRVVDADETGALLEVDGGRQQVTYAEVAKAFVQIEFNRPDAAGAEGG